MRIDSTFTVAECERYLAEFGPNDNEIVLPIKARRAALGGEAAIWQLVTTWAVTRRPATLRLYAQQPDEVNEFVRRLHGLIAGLCADKAVSVKSGADLLPEVFRSALRRLEEMHGTKPANASRGPNFEIVCADHLNRGVPRQLYFKTEDGEMKLKSESEFQSLARTAVKAAVPDSFIRILNPADVNAIGSMLYEIFRNTDDHALYNVEGVRLPKSVRGFRTRYFQVKPSDLDRMTHGSEPLRKFCETLTPPHAYAKTLRLFEISVFDSGPGYAERWLDRRTREFTATEEHDAVRACFDKYATTKRHSSAGKGLTYVIRLLREKNGFLRLRTGRLSLYADFGDWEGQGNVDDLPELLGATKPDGSIDLLPRVEGTLVTLIVPLRTS